MGFSVLSIAEYSSTDSLPIACLKREWGGYGREMLAVCAIVELVLIPNAVEGETEVQLLEMSFVDKDLLTLLFIDYTFG